MYHEKRVLEDKGEYEDYKHISRPQSGAVDSINTHLKNESQQGCSRNQVLHPIRDFSPDDVLFSLCSILDYDTA